MRELATNPGRRLRILDYAAGKGRLAVALADSLSAEVRARIEYFAFNERGHDLYREECIRNTALLHAEDAVSRVRVEISDFFEDERVDVVVMSNFLHEVEPRAWGTHFDRAAKVLTDGGVLVVMEDQEPSVGELPTENGFIVLSLTEMRLLFGRTTSVRALQQDERLTAFEIPREILKAYSDTHLRDTLIETRRRAADALHLLRQKKTAGSPQNQGRRHAFLALLFASAALTLDGMPASAINQ